MKLKQATYLTVLLIGIVFILIIGKHIIIPLILAGLVWFLVKEIRKRAERIPFIGKRLPLWVLNLISVAILYSVLGFTVHLLTGNIKALSSNTAEYETNLKHFNSEIKSTFDIDILSLMQDVEGKVNFSETFEGLLTYVSSLLSNTFMIGLYLLFMLLEETLFNTKLMSLYNSEKKKKEVQHTLTQISNSIGSYITLKTIVSLITGVLSYITLAILGIHSPLFWAFLIFILNFIPTIGSLTATLFPTAMALLQFGDINKAVVVLVCVGAIQVIIGNIIEPKIMGNSLNVSSLVVLLALSFWGAIWGITGMVLSVPITVILVIMCGQFEATKNIAIMLSDKGKLNN